MSPLLVLAVAWATAGQDTAGLFEALRWRHIGPAGNRVIAVVGQPGEPDVYHIGAASGGVFRSTDGGHSWTPVFDDQPAASIGALAVAASDPNVVWAGTGETFIRANISIGNGIYRSTDGGESWEHRGLDRTGRIGRVAVHPRDADRVYACALGHIYGPQPERGVYRTVDGGRTWERVLHVDEDTGCSDLVMDPANPRVLLAGMWEVEVSTWSRRSGGPGSGLWRSVDGGDTWEKLGPGQDGDAAAASGTASGGGPAGGAASPTAAASARAGAAEGLPAGPWGKIGLGMSPDDPDRVYALIETSSNRDFAPVDPFQGVLWRSDDGGDSWEMVNASSDLAARPLYYSRLAVAPDDADELYFLAPSHQTSLDGGRAHFETDPQPGYDHHDMWIDPRDPERRIVGHDGGVSISTDGGEHWFRPQLPIAQMYHAHVDDRVPYYVYGNRQDGPSTHGPSNSLTGDGIPIGAWRSVGGCEVGFAVPDTVDDRTVWTGCYDGILERHDLETGHSRDVSVWPLAVESWPAEELEYRWQWTFPVEISPHDHERVYVGSQYVHVTTDGGQSWERISPDLTSDDPELQRRTGGLTLDDAGPTIAPVVFAIAESPLEEGVIWAGTNDGLVQVTRDGGETWTDVTANLPGLPPRGTVSNIEPSRHDPERAYLTVDRHQLGDFDPYIYRTEDHGRSWERIDAGIPRSVFSYAHVVVEDPERPGLLFAGTENAVWVSFDDGASWRSLQSNLPHAPVHWLAIQEPFGDLVAATYGRGFWILDDITPLRELSAEMLAGEGGDGEGRGGGRGGDAGGRGGTTAASGGRLFAPRPAYRFRMVEEPMTQPGDPAAGEDPEYGAALHYWLPAELPPDAALELTILDAGGEVVRSFAPSAASGSTVEGAGDTAGGGGEPDADEDAILSREGGLHRVWWDLRSEKTRRVELRTRPQENPHLGMPEEGWRPLEDGGRISILQPPGTYTVRLAAGGDTLWRDLEVRKDPNTAGSEADIAAQVELLESLWELQDRSAAVIEDTEWLRRQLRDLRARLGAAAPPPVLTAADSLDAALKEVEGRFFDLRHTGEGQDGLRWKRLLYARLDHLASSIGGSDHRPTDQHREVHALLRERVEEAERAFREVREGRLRDFNALLRERGLDGILSDPPAEGTSDR